MVESDPNMRILASSKAFYFITKFAVLDVIENIL